MNIKELLLNNIEEGYFPSLPKYPEYNDNSKEPYLNAINYLRQIDSYKVPLEKLTVIALISVIITDCVDKYWDSMKNNLAKKYLNIDADELMSIYLYIIYKLNMPSLYVHLDFIKYFTTPISKWSSVRVRFSGVNSSMSTPKGVISNFRLVYFPASSAMAWLVEKSTPAFFRANCSKDLCSTLLRGKS